jgi:DNA-binding NtrC family response regulator
MPETRHVLVALSDQDGRGVIARALTGRGLEPVYASTLAEVRMVLKREPVAMVFFQHQLADGNYRDILGENARDASKLPVIVCSPFTDDHLYMDAMCRGAFDFVAYPYSRQEVDWIVNSALPRAAAAGAS